MKTDNDLKSGQFAAIETTIQKRTQMQSIAFFICVCGVSTWLAWNLGLSNNWKMRTMNNAFSQITHPQETVFVSQHEGLGLLIGNGDHCDFFVGQLRSFSGSPQSIETFYSKVKFWSSLENSWEPANVLILKNREIPPSEQEYLPSQFNSASKWLLPFHKQKEKYYIVYFFDVGYDAGFDIRCL